MSGRLLSLIYSIVFLLTPSFPHALAADLPEQKFVTLQSNKLSLQQALAEITKQTGIRLDEPRGFSNRSLQLNLNHVAFWPALDTIASSAKARVNLYPTSGRIVVSKRGDNYRLPPLSYDGRFRLCVKKVTATRDLESGRGATQLALEVAWDPELQPLYLETRPHAVQLVDDKNNILRVPDEGSSFAPVDGLIAQELNLQLPALPRSVEKINSLQGSLSAIGPSKMLTFHFDALDKIAKANRNDPERNRTKENVSCSIRDVKLHRDRWTIQLALLYPPDMKQLDSNQSWVVNNELTLMSLDGKNSLASTDYVLESATSRRAVLSYHFRDKGNKKRGKASAWKLSYRTPAKLIEMPISFTFKNIPLP